MSFLLIGNWDVELARLKIFLLDGEQALRDLDPTYLPGHPVSVLPGVNAGPPVDCLSEDLSLMRAFAGTAGGSNNWALAGSRTESGRPLLANDPHLDATLPPHWYLAHLKAPGWEVAGAALIGAPAFGAAHNGFAAWGITAALTDMVDLFLEEIGPDGQSVRRGDGFEACERRTEVIEVRRQAPVVEEVLVTPRGPIVSPALDPSLPALSLRALWLDARPVRGFLTAHKARSFDAFRSEFAQWPVLPQNVAYADSDGHIAWLLVGEVPRRRKGWGTLPLPGWDPETGWEDDPVPLSEMPFALDPPDGFVASANNKPLADGEGPFLGVDWIDGYRAERIFGVLREHDRWSLEATRGLHLDEVSLAWRDIRDAVLSVEPLDEHADFALSLFRQWDGRLAVDSAAATLYHAFISQVWRQVAEARAPRSAHFAMGKGFSELLPFTTFAYGRMSRIHELVREQPPGWLDRPWSEVISAALSTAVQQLRSGYGAEPRGWQWGELRPLVLKHPLGQIEPLSAVYNRGPFPWGGDGNTVSQAGSAIGRVDRNPSPIASLRAIIDVGNWDESRFSLPGGQSGNPFSPHYDDLLPRWLTGDGVPIAWSAQAVASVTRHTLRLLPLT
jgi:penicillin amidase